MYCAIKKSMLLVSVFCLLVLCRSPGGKLSALDLEVSGGLGNLAFDREDSSSRSAANKAFAPHIFPLALVRVSGEYRGLAYHAAFERDPLMGNRLSAAVRGELDFLFLEAGPFTGLFNTEKQPVNPGLSAALGMVFPGIAFVQAGGMSTLGNTLDARGTYSQLSGDISAGFWVPYVVCSLNVSTRNNTLRQEGNLLVEDETVRYFFRAEVYTKNVPYTIRLDLGYQSLRRSYTTEGVAGGNLVKDTQEDEVKSFYAGIEGTYTIRPGLKLLLAGELPVYFWGVRPLEDPPEGTVLFQFRTGIVLTLPGGGYE
jgi:hypothetical protein